MGTIEALLELLGDACPLKRLLAGSAMCIQLGSNESDNRCTETLRGDGLPYCYRNGDGRCEPNPMALELDVLLAVGVRDPRVGTFMRGAIQECREAQDGTTCGTACVS